MNDKPNDPEPKRTFPPEADVPPPDRTTDHEPAAEPDRTTDHTPAPAADTGRRPDTSVGPRDPDGPTATFHPEPDRTGGYVDSDAPPPRKPGEPDIPGFQILGEIARGGMGVVYKAWDLALEREVALKMILAGPHATETAIGRFFTEARAAARFKHRHIVPIYQVGEVGGLPFFSLEFVDGGTLAKKIAREPQSPRYAAEVVAQLADAIQYAHDRGIAHRDLKPANVLLEADGTPKVTDFGLAKELKGDSGQTQSGQILGTPSYMAPEQAAGRDDVGPPADIYALGAILYDLLTGRPPFAGSSVIDTLEMVRTREPVAPSQLAARLPRDLETICLKCLQKDIARRYASAKELAEDLNRFLAGKPILARPVSAPEKAWRWAKRNPVGAVAIALAAVVLVGGPLAAVRMSVLKTQAEQDRDAKGTALAAEQIATTQAKMDRDAKGVALQAEEQAKIAAQKAFEEKSIALVAEEKAKTEADARRIEAEKAQAEAIAQALQTLNAIRGILFDVDDRMRNNAVLAPLRLQIFEKMLVDLDKLRTLVRNSPLKGQSEAAAYTRMGEIYFRANRVEDAAEWLRKAAPILVAQIEDSPDRVAAVRNAAAISNVTADVELRLGETAKALELYTAALKLRQERVRLYAAKPPDNVQLKIDADVDVATSFRLIAGAQLQLGEPAAAAANYLTADKAFAALPAQRRESLRVRSERAGIQDMLGDARFKLGDRDAADTCYRAALKERTELLRVTPKPPHEVASLKVQIAQSHLTIGDFLLVGRGQVEAATAEYTLSYTQFTALLADEPDNLVYQRAVGYAHYRLGMVGGPLTGFAHFAACLKLRAALAKIDPKDTQAKIEWMLALGRCGQAAEAEKLADQLKEQAAKDRRVLFQRACGLSVAAGSASDPAVAARCRDKAHEALAALVAGGWKDRVGLETDPDLDAVRGDPRFVALLKQLLALPPR